MEYLETTDDNGHRYVIPLEERHNWHHWVAAVSEDDPKSWDVPEYAVRVDGGDVIFEGWRVL